MLDPTSEIRLNPIGEIMLKYVLNLCKLMFDGSNVVIYVTPTHIYFLWDHAIFYFLIFF